MSFYPTAFPGLAPARYLDYLSFACQRALYEIAFSHGNADMGWQEFVLLLRSQAKLRTAARAVIRHALRTCPSGQLHFDSFAPVDFFGPDAPETLEAARLFDEKEAGRLLFRFRQRCMQAQYALLHARDPAYREIDYTRDVQLDEIVRGRLRHGFEDALRRFDFKALWVCDEIKETRFLWDDTPPQ